MPSVFKNADVVLTSAIQDVYTCPAATTAVVLGAQYTGKRSISAGLMPVWIYRAPASGPTILLVQPYFPVGAPTSGGFGQPAVDNPLKAKVVLNAGDKIRAQYDPVDGTSTDCLSLAILELS